ncbi:hypothetical protein [Halalkalibacter krulwichiae]|uniref:Uncharacterized protein n=1 Tax=Halalkalibacter krulwichiae TaxID=199441 RepID=A0A1X9MHC1_9BACI|nr:hypothetical protein [Halalkalibacter krulwichiae]ARK31523.1 hypothetical protein BkAM31D_17690 [Halalkalibacter krulwichiae]
MVKKAIVASAAAVVGAATVLLGDRNRRTKISQSVQKILPLRQKEKNKLNVAEKKKNLGHSHPYDYEDNKMVGEGALTSVQYYNKKQQTS